MLKVGQLAVVVPVYNDADNLRHCLFALAASRKEQPVPIYVVDDGSSDGALAVASDFEVKYIRSERNRGQSWARNHGARLSGSDYVLFVDSDVVVNGDCIEKLEAFMTADKPDGLVGLQGAFSLQHPFRQWASLIYNTLQHLLTRGPRYHPAVNTSCVLIWRAEFEATGAFREDLWFMEDAEFGRRLARRGKYLLRGSVSFVHRKQVTWRWLIRAYVLSGKMQRVLAEGPSQPMSTPCPQAAGSRLLWGWLVCGPLLVAAAALTPAALGASLGFFVLCAVGVVLGLFCASCRPLWRVSRNPAFLATGALVYLILPWLVALGSAIATISRAGQYERNLWRKSDAGRSARALERA